MCIFCERAKASLDPSVDLDGTAWIENSVSDDHQSSSLKTSRRLEVNLQQKRDAEQCNELRRRARLPVTVITGFLGAGKTTFVNHILSARHGRRLAVIENEFGEVPIDDELLGDGGVERGEEAQQVILMPNGCMCCRVRGDLVAALKRFIVGATSMTAIERVNVSPQTIKSREDVGRSGEARSTADSSTTKAKAEERVKLDGIILECSGLDELAPVLQTFFADSFVQEHVRLDAVVGLCDSPSLLRTLMPAVSEGGSVMPDRGYSSAEAEEKEERAELRSAEERSDSTSTLVMSQLALSDRILLNKSDLLSDAEGEVLVTAVKERFPGASITRCVRGKVDIELVLDVKGFSLDKALQMDQQFAELLRDEAGDTKTPAGVAGGAHGHDRLGARSVGIELSEAPIDWVRFKSWLKGFLDQEGQRIWRLKGVLWTSTPGLDERSSPSWGWNSSSRTVLQGLYGHFESEVGDWPVTATRRSRVVFIGDLPIMVRERLEAGVRSCVVVRRPRPHPSVPQRRAAPRPGAHDNAFARRLGYVKFGGADEDLLM